MSARSDLGRSAERWAALFLRLRGWRILAQRYRTPVGEVDLIAQRQAQLIFVEVKARSTLDAALTAVRPQHQQRIRRAAEQFLQREIARRPGQRGAASIRLRFDVIAVLPRSPGWLPPRCLHLPNCF